MGFFALVTFVFLALVITLFMLIPTRGPATNFIPIQQVQEPDKIQWEQIAKLSGQGLLIDSQGNTIKSYNGYKAKEKYSVEDLGNLFLRSKNPLTHAEDFRENNEKTNILYKTLKGDFLLLSYPIKNIYFTPTVDINEAMGKDVGFFFIPLIILFLLYIFFLYLLIKRLTNRINREIQSIQKEEDKRKDMFFRGLAHDTKTPLSSILAYSTALKDGMVSEEKVQDYYQSIVRNGNVLKERINDMLELSKLQAEPLYNGQKQDILECIRRYIGDNYSWYSEQGAQIDLKFSQNQKYFLNFDQKLMERLLQNILQNSVVHNEPGVQIQVDFNEKKKTLAFYDNGKGIPKEIQDTLFEPMVTGDQSRSGEKLRGLGLANVKRIVDLHGWDIQYKDGFIIKM